eukprot:TRINITY_DN18414_c0_g1_i1.p1 TRINITY_DN18414_c0_g1~~TRINITY_DN18414_c0_g1_i1.p1  ORF type:complete len:1251 (+),score=348.94 TRINITY_DN18414_c0_g1_i1:210-3962(+)
MDEFDDFDVEPGHAVGTNFGRLTTRDDVHTRQTSPEGEVTPRTRRFLARAQSAEMDRRASLQDSPASARNVTSPIPVEGSPSKDRASDAPPPPRPKALFEEGEAPEDEESSPAKASYPDANSPPTKTASKEMPSKAGSQGRGFKTSRSRSSSPKRASLKQSFPDTFSADVERKLRDRLRFAVSRRGRYEKEIAERLFRQFDKNNSGTLDCEEFKRVMRVELRISEKQLSNSDIRKFASCLDADKNGHIDVKELLEFLHEPGDDELPRLASREKPSHLATPASPAGGRLQRPASQPSLHHSTATPPDSPARVTSKRPLHATMPVKHKFDEGSFEAIVGHYNTSTFMKTSCLGNLGRDSSQKKPAGLDVTQVMLSPTAKSKSTGNLPAATNLASGLPVLGGRRGGAASKLQQDKKRSEKFRTTFLTLGGGGNDLLLPSVSVRWQEWMTTKKSLADALGKDSSIDSMSSTAPELAGTLKKAMRPAGKARLVKGAVSHWRLVPEPKKKSGNNDEFCPSPSSPGSYQPSFKREVTDRVKELNSSAMGLLADGKDEANADDESKGRPTLRTLPSRLSEQGEKIVQTLSTSQPCTAGEMGAKFMASRRRSVQMEGLLPPGGLPAAVVKKEKLPGIDTNEGMLKRSYRHLAVDGDFPRDRLSAAFKLMGYLEIEEDVVQELVTKHIKDRHFLDYGEFVDVSGDYEKVYMQKLVDEMIRTDTDGNGELDKDELVALLAREGITVVPGVMLQIIREIAADGRDTLIGIDEYTQLRKVIRLRGGFAKDEAAVLFELFERYDQNEDGRINVEELTTALTWIGAAVDKAGVDKLLHGIEFSSSGQISEVEFMQIMRRHREQDVAVVASYRKEFDRTGKAPIDVESTVNVLQLMGYQEANQTIVLECAAEHDIDESDGFPTFDIVMVMLAYRRREGAANEEIEEFKNLFEMFDEDDSGSIGEVELGGMLRWLGFPSTMELQQELMAEVDIDRSGFLDFDEFLKVMRKYRDTERRAVQKAFEKRGGADAVLPLEELHEIVALLSYYNPGEDVQDEFDEEYGQEEFDFNSSIRYIKSFRNMAREAFNKNHGFINDELEKLQAQFKQHDPNDTGYISGTDMQRLLLTLVPDSLQAGEARTWLTDAVETADLDKDGCLAWYEYLKLSRLVKDRNDGKRIEYEQEVGQEVGFSFAEVRDLRSIYKMRPIQEEGLSFLDLCDLLEQIKPIDSQLKKTIRDVFKEVCDPNTHQLDFAEFLRLMAQIQTDLL